MSAIWYYLEDVDESDKKGPCTLEFILENITSDCLISNDEMLKSDTPWMLLSELIDPQSDDTNNTLIGANIVKNNKNKQIEIKIETNNDQHVIDDDIDDIDDNNDNNTDLSMEQETENEIKQQKQEKEEKEKQNKIRKEQEEKLKKQVLNIKSDEIFDEEWFILSSTESTESRESDNSSNKTLGPFTRWELLKQWNEKKINENTITYLNGSKEYRYLRMCGELRGLLPFIDRNATIQNTTDQLLNNKHVLLTKDELENKQYFYKDPYQQKQGPISLMEIFYKLEDGILGRNSEIKQDDELCWKTVEFIQKKFSREWVEMTKMKKQKQQNMGKEEEEDMEDINKNNKQDIDVSDVESDIDDKELEYKYHPSFRALIDLDKKTQIEKKIKQKYPDKIGDLEGNNNNNNNNKKKRKRKRKRENKKKPKQISSIYITGLPLDITVYEMHDFFKRAGVIGTDIYQKGKKMITLYKDDKDNNKLKGDALITYHQPHSVQLAIDLLDETEIRNGYPVHIAIAKSMDDGGQRKKKRKLDPKKEATLKELYGVESQLTWNDDIRQNVPQLNWIVLSNMFNLDEMNKAQSIDIFINDLKNEVISECSKIGMIDKIEIFETNPKGIIKIKYKYPQHAAECINKMNRRYFDGNVVDCFYWDGTTDYDVRETAEEQQQRLKRFQRVIQSGGDIDE